MKFSSKCKTEKLGMIYTRWEAFAYFLIGKGPIFGPKSSQGNSLLESNSKARDIHIFMLIMAGLS